MKKLWALTILTMAMGAAGLRAEEAPKTKWDAVLGYFKNLKQGLAESSVEGQYQKRNLAAVAAVRGADQKDEKANPDKPRMKDPVREKKIKVRKAEAREFEKAAELGAAGKFDEALAALEAFEKAHPQSPLLPELRAAKAQAQAALREQKAETAKGEPAGQKP